MKLNPKWKWHNDTFNEGCEGYNPHPKWIAEVAAPAVQTVPAGGKVYRDSRGQQIDPVALIAEAEGRLARVTDPIGRSLIEKTIANYRKMLEG